MTLLGRTADSVAGRGLRFVRHGKSILPLNVRPAERERNLRLLSPFIGRMSFGRLFLGRLLASRARLRFAVQWLC
jgi:hypothetical protein